MLCIACKYKYNHNILHLSFPIVEDSITEIARTVLGHKARGLRHVRALSSYNERCLRHVFKRARFPRHFIEEIKKLHPRALLSNIYPIHTKA